MFSNKRFSFAGSRSLVTVHSSLACNNNRKLEANAFHKVTSELLTMFYSYSWFFGVPWVQIHDFSNHAPLELCGQVLLHPSKKKPWSCSIIAGPDQCQDGSCLADGNLSTPVSLCLIHSAPRYCYHYASSFCYRHLLLRGLGLPGLGLWWRQVWLWHWPFQSNIVLCCAAGLWSS